MVGKIIVQGGQKLHGKVSVSGAKNAALPVLAASLLTPHFVKIENIPDLYDIRIMQQVLQNLGAKITKEEDSFTIAAGQVTPKDIAEDLMRKMRASNLMMGPLLARFGYVKAPYPGGCAIGSRPMDLHLKGFKALGAHITEKHGHIIAETKCLKGAEIHLDFPSVGATENLLMAATLAEGYTVIRNAAKEPEIHDLAEFLAKMGAQIEGAGTDVIKIKGVQELGPVESHSIIPDRVEAGTFMIAGAMTGGDIIVQGARSSHLEALIAKMKEAGVRISEDECGIRVSCNDCINPVDIITLPYPGFPTDLQPQMMAMLTVANGTSIISESIFENRFKHVGELQRMGANIKVEGRVAIIKGVPALSGSSVEATDLRAGAALILVGLVAEGETVIESTCHIYRGYEKIETKLKNLGANIQAIRHQ